MFGNKPPDTREEGGGEGGRGDGKILDGTGSGVRTPTKAGPGSVVGWLFVT